MDQQQLDPLEDQNLSNEPEANEVESVESSESTESTESSEPSEPENTENSDSTSPSEPDKTPTEQQFVEELTELQAKIYALTEKVTTLESIDPQMQEQLNSFVEKVASLEGVSSILSQQLQDLSAALEKLSSKVTTLESEAPLPQSTTTSAPLGEIQEFLVWANKRENLQPKDPTFYVYEESYIKARVMLDPLKNHIDERIWPQLLNSLTLHYVICEDYTYSDESGFDQKNPLYTQYKIGSKSFIVSSASDESSSSSIHTTKSLNEGDFTMQDLIRTRYGQYVYSVLEQIDVSAVLL